MCGRGKRVKSGDNGVVQEWDLNTKSEPGSVGSREQKWVAGMREGSTARGAGGRGREHANKECFGPSARATFLPNVHAHDNGGHRQGRAVKSLLARDPVTSDNAGPARPGAAVPGPYQSRFPVRRPAR